MLAANVTQLSKAQLSLWLLKVCIRGGWLLWSRNLQWFRISLNNLPEYNCVDVVMRENENMKWLCCCCAPSIISQMSNIAFEIINYLSFFVEESISRVIVSKQFTFFLTYIVHCTTIKYMHDLMLFTFELCLSWIFTSR